MKATKITYWVSTSVLALMMTYSAYAYFTDPMTKENFHRLGFPDYFRVELAIAKLLGVVLLLVPAGQRIKEWAYAGFTITFISAFISHAAAGDPVFFRVMPVIFLFVLFVSYMTSRKALALKEA